MAATVTQTTDANGNQIFDVATDGESRITLATANTYVDKNIVINIRSKNIYTYDAANENLIVTCAADILNSQGVGF